MLLMQKSTGHLVDVLELKELFDPFVGDFTGRLSYGEDLPEPEKFMKTDICFQSGELLPKCWLDPHYRDEELHRSA
jgi:hypothetical protein